MEMSVDDISKERTSSRNLGSGAYWRCQVIVAAPPAPTEPVVAVKGGKVDKSKLKAEADYLIRANSLAGYWEMNRRFLRTLAANAPVTPRPQSAAEDSGTSALISSSAQISPDSLLGEGTRVGDRASIKKCIIGRHCVIGRGAKLTGCVLWDFVTVEEK
jgi:translation initiation factor eIF-2B subunit gamma